MMREKPLVAMVLVPVAMRHEVSRMRAVAPGGRGRDWGVGF